MPEPVEFVRQARRVRTETALLDAFEAVLIREGAGGVTVQAVAKAAGVTKTLIYKYFDGMEGLIKVWAREREIFIPLEELFPDPAEAAETMHANPYAFAKEQIIKQAQHMRYHPVYIELCLAEIAGSGPVIDALLELRRERNEAESKALGETLDGTAIPMLLPMMLMPAAVTYLAMRARKSPLFAGMVQLDTDEGWASMMAAVEQLIDLIGLAAQLAELTNADQQQLMDKFRNNLGQATRQHTA
ncbi:MAG: TetR/AcrR family transcriptional regulator [Gammaproteobacteria bacterium]